jgi:hypothetical protein
MAKITVRRSYIGKAHEPISCKALFNICKALWGDDVIELPVFPKVFGGVRAWWIGGDGTQHNCDSLEDLRNAYEKELTAYIFIWGSLNNGPSIEFRYWPAKAEVKLILSASDQIMADNLVEVVKIEFPLVIKFVFISYATSEVSFATFIKDILERRLPPGISVFVAKPDILPGSNPMKVILEEQLLKAEALIALCSRQSKASPWLWWESSAVWARGGLVIPLFIDIEPEDFNGPLSHVCQGRSFEVNDLNSVLLTIINRISPGEKIIELSNKEVEELERLKTTCIY